MSKLLRKFLNKEVRVILEVGNATITVEGILKEVGKEWISIKSNKEIRFINRNSVVIMERKSKQ
jgi:small nuclear ribonucleoprotein (snRNP)-like protein